jgi:FixJ family two-component response regulator
MPGTTVFIVDDDASVRKALERLIRAHGYGVEAIDGGQAYLDHALPTAPACLVLDIKMPGVSGLDVQRQISGTARDLPIVFITGHGDEEECAEALRRGAVEVLHKPLEAEVLLSAIARAVAHSERR